VSVKFLEADFAPRTLSPSCSFRRANGRSEVVSVEALAAVLGSPTRSRLFLAQRLPEAAHRPSQALPTSRIEVVNMGGK